jgi:hypothetical protein
MDFDRTQRSHVTRPGEGKPIDLSERSADLERRHPWEAARSTFLLTLLERMGVTGAMARWLDVGAGNAWVAQQAISRLSADSLITCWDVNFTDEDLRSETARHPGLLFVSEAPTSRFDGILMLDVIEHIEDDLGFVRDIVGTMMAEDAWMLVSVPAYQGLFTSHDTALKHYRRYSPSQCVGLLRAAGLRIEVKGAMFHSLLGVRCLRALKERVAAPPAQSVGVGAWSGGPLLTAAATRALEWEGNASLAMTLRTRHFLPGLSFWAFSRREQA